MAHFAIGGSIVADLVRRHKDSIAREAEKHVIKIGKAGIKVIAHEGKKFLRSLFNGTEGEFVRDLSPDRQALFFRLIKRISPTKRQSDLMNLRVSEAIIWAEREADAQMEAMRSTFAKILKTAALNHRVDGEMSLPAVTYGSQGDPEIQNLLVESYERVGGGDFAPLLTARENDEHVATEGHDVSAMVNADVAYLNESVFTSGLVGCVIGTSQIIGLSERMDYAPDETVRTFLSADPATTPRWDGTVELQIEEGSRRTVYLPRLSADGVPTYENGVRGVAPHDVRYPVSLAMTGWYDLPRFNDIEWAGHSSRSASDGTRNILFNVVAINGVERIFMRYVSATTVGGEAGVDRLALNLPLPSSGYYYGASTLLPSTERFTIGPDDEVVMKGFYLGREISTGNGAASTVFSTAAQMVYGSVGCIPVTRLSGRINGKYIDVDGSLPSSYHLGRYDDPTADMIHDLVITTHLDKSMVKFRSVFSHILVGVERHMRKTRSATPSSTASNVLVTDQDRRPFVEVLAQNVLGLKPERAAMIADTASWFLSRGAFGGVDRVGLEPRLRTFFNYMTEAYKTISTRDLVRHD